MKESSEIIKTIIYNCIKKEYENYTKNNNILIPNVFNVSNANFCTTISNEHGVSISTIEHLMAALFIKGVDNSLVEVDAEELPILDGSAKEFVKKIETVGLETSQNPI